MCVCVCVLCSHLLTPITNVAANKRRLEELSGWNSRFISGMTCRYIVNENQQASFMISQHQHSEQRSPSRGPERHRTRGSASAAVSIMQNLHN